MDRLTERDEYGNAFGKDLDSADFQWTSEKSVVVSANLINRSQDMLNRLAAYEDTGLTPEEVRDMMTDWIVWKQAAAGGRLLILPCKVGDTVWVNICGKTVEYEVARFRVPVVDLRSRDKEVQFGIAFDVDRLGNGFYLTRSEAEAAMKGEDDGN